MYSESTKLTPFEMKLVQEHREKLKKGTLLKCPHDDYEWIYKGDKKDGYTSCPKCFYSVHVIRHQVKK